MNATSRQFDRGLNALLHKALHETSDLWPSVRKAYQWVYAVADVLNNPDALSHVAVRRKLRGIVGAMQRWQSLAGPLQPVVAHFLKVTRSYWPGLFHCCAVPDLPPGQTMIWSIFLAAIDIWNDASPGVKSLLAPWFCEEEPAWLLPLQRSRDYSDRMN